MEEKKFSMTELVSFGNYLLSERRQETIVSGEPEFVYDADIQNWLAEELANQQWDELVEEKENEGDN